MAKPIEMNIKEDSGYDVLWPETISENTLLSETTNNLFGYIDGNVDTALVQLFLGGQKYGYAITIYFPDGSPAEGIVINGLQNVAGESLITNENGFALGVSTSNNTNVSVTSPYLDLQDIASTTIQSQSIITNKDLYFQSVSNYVLITNSGEYKLSPIVKTFDLCAVGGGGGSADVKNESPSAGGGGGYVENLLNQSYMDKIIVSIGSGGTAGNGSTAGGNGGSTIIKNSLQQNILSVEGGKGASQENPGTGNGDGGKPFRTDNGINSPPSTSFGGNGKIYVFNDETLPLPGGGGGAGGKYNQRESRNGYMANAGQQFGGRGFYKGLFSSTQDVGGGEPGKVPGGGGGGGVSNSYTGGKGSSSGASGGVYVRVHY